MTVTQNGAKGFADDILFMMKRPAHAKHLPLELGPGWVPGGVHETFWVKVKYDGTIRAVRFAYEMIAKGNWKLVVNQNVIAAEPLLHARARSRKAAFV